MKKFWLFLLFPVPLFAQASAPTFSLAAGSYTGSHVTTLSSNGSVICYTHYNSAYPVEPQTNGVGSCLVGAQYTSALIVNMSETFHAVAGGTGFSDSTVSTVSYTVSKTCDVNATTTNFATQLAATSAGQTLCLAAGSYGTFTGANKSSPGIIITGLGGASTPTMGMNFCANNTVQWFTLDNVIVTSGSDWCNPTSNVSITNTLIKDSIAFWTHCPDNHCSGFGSTMNSVNVTFNYDEFQIPFGTIGGGSGDGRLIFRNDTGTSDLFTGLTVQNTKFDAGCDDGIDFIGSGRGVAIGPGNEFFNLYQNNNNGNNGAGTDCGVHIDEMQLQNTDAIGPVVSGNYFHDGETGEIGYDGANDMTVVDNVFQRICRQDEVMGAGDATGTHIHNTIVGTGVGCVFASAPNDMNCGETHQGNICRSSFTNNIANSMEIQCNPSCGAPSVNDYELYTGGSNAGGAHSLVCTPTFTGGATPTTFAGFQLTAVSCGHAAANDGKDIGVAFGSATPNGANGAPCARCFLSLVDLHVDLIPAF
jgi:hypothetical protein